MQNNNYYVNITIVRSHIATGVLLQGCTPLHIAVLHGHEQVALELLSKKADLNTANEVIQLLKMH